MRYAAIDYVANVYGADTLQLLLDGINRFNPDVGYTKANCKIVLLMPYGDPAKPRLTIVRVQKGDNLADQLEFVYERHNITDIAATRPPLVQADWDAMKAMRSSAEMLDYLARKWNYNLTPEDFWVNISSKEYAGGTVTPNWELRSIYNSMCYWGTRIVQLHPGP